MSCSLVYCRSRMTEDGMGERKARAMVRELLGPYLS